MLVLWAVLQLCAAQDSVQQWGRFETTLKGPSEATSDFNPFVDVVLHGTFACDDQSPVRVRGFYDGEGQYKLRFMPSTPGKCTYVSDSTQKELDNIKGTFTVTELDSTQYGQSPVRTRNTRSLVHMDGSAHFRYIYNHVEPEHYPYVGKPPTTWDFTTFNFIFWQRMDKRIEELRDAGVQADIILFHPYDDGHWGFDCMGGRDPDTYDTSNDEHYLKYIVARLGAYHNVWWSMANEWDLVQCKRRGVGKGPGAPLASPVWDDLFRTLAAEDKYGHLTSVHNCMVLYNHSRPWITHISSQGGYDMAHIKRKYAAKPIIWDEVMYDGDIGMWGGLTGGQMADRFWWGLSYGIYVGHGETITYTADPKDNDQVLWWSKGSILRGDSPARIKWFADLVSPHFDAIDCTCAGWGASLCDESCGWAHAMGDGVNVATDEETVYFVHTSAYNSPPHPPRETTLVLPAGDWQVQPVDIWNMKVLPSTATLKGAAGGGKAVLSPDVMTFDALTNNETTAPCKRSGASCCSSDPHSCTAYMMMITRAR